MIDRIDIEKVRFEFDIESEEMAFELNSRWDSFFTTAFEKNVEKVLCDFNPKNRHLQIKRLELDLGEIEQKEFYSKFPEILAEKLEAELQKLLFTDIEQQNGTAESKPENAFEALTYYLIHGFYPWPYSNSSPEIHTLFANVLAQSSVRFKAFLQQYGHYSSLRKRLVYQLKDDALGQVVAVVNKAESNFIIAYFTVLTEEYSRSIVTFTHRRDHRDAVWTVILSYLLCNSESHFNRKEFSRQTIAELAAHYNLKYTELLELLVSSLSKIQSGLVKPELESILNDLFMEIEPKSTITEAYATEIKKVKQLLSGEIQTDVFTEAFFLELIGDEKFRTQLIAALSGEKLFLFIDKINALNLSSSLKQAVEAELILSVHRPIDGFIKRQPQYLSANNISGSIPVYLKNEYFQLLKQAQYRRKLIKELREAQLILLVKLIEPNESEFIISYAKALDQQKERNQLEGKAGGEFKKLKWEFLLTVLMEDHLSSFNRKQFVLSVVAMLASHYNMKKGTLLSYLYQSVIDRELSVPEYLKSILSELYFELKEKKKEALEINLLDRETQENFYAEVVLKFIQTGFIGHVHFNDKIYSAFKYLQTYRPDLLSDLLETLKKGFVLFDQTSIPSHKELYRELILFTISTYQINLPGGRNVKRFFENLADDRYRGTNIPSLKTFLLALLQNKVDVFELSWDLLTGKTSDQAKLIDLEFSFVTNDQLLQLFNFYDRPGFDLFIHLKYKALFSKLLSDKRLFMQFIEICAYNQGISEQLYKVLSQLFVYYLRRGAFLHFQAQLPSVEISFEFIQKYLQAKQGMSAVQIAIQLIQELGQGQPKALEKVLVDIYSFASTNDPSGFIALLEKFVPKYPNLKALQIQLKELKKDPLKTPKKNLKGASAQNRDTRFLKWLYAASEASDELKKAGYKNIKKYYSESSKKLLAKIIDSKPDLVLKGIYSFYPDHLPQLTIVIKLIEKYLNANQRKLSNLILVQFIYHLMEGNSKAFEIALSEIYRLCMQADHLDFFKTLDKLAKNQGSEVLAQLKEVKKSLLKQQAALNEALEPKSKDEYFFQWLFSRFGTKSPALQKGFSPSQIQNDFALTQLEQILINQPQLITQQLISGQLSEVRLAQWIKTAPVPVQLRWLQAVPVSFYKVQIQEAFVLFNWTRSYFSEHNLHFPEVDMIKLLIDFSSGKHTNLTKQDLFLKLLHLCLENVPLDGHENFLLVLKQKAANKGKDWEALFAGIQSKMVTEIKQKEIPNDTLSEKKKPEIEEEMAVLETIYVNNAGLVICSPYLPRLFEILKLTENGVFVDEDKQGRAVLLMQYLAFEKTSFPEHEMVLNKVMCGFRTGTPINTNIELEEREKETIGQMVQGIIQNWPPLKNTSPQGFRESFLMRNGKLELKDDAWHLTVESKSFDMLLDQLPWTYKLIKHHWMNKPIHVKWR